MIKDIKLSRSILGLIILTLGINYSVYSQWVWKNPLPQGNTLYKVTSSGNNTVFAIGENNTFIKSTNGGKDWTVKNDFQINNNAFSSVDFYNENIGIISGENGLLLKTVNGGTTWERLNTNTNLTFNEVQFISEKIIYLTAAEELLKSNDGGNTWKKIVLNNDLNSITSAYFINSSKGWLLGISDSANYKRGIILKTEDGGKSWGNISRLSYTAREIEFSDSLHGWLTINNTFRKTTDGGKNWKQIFIDTYAHIYSIHFIDSENGWAVGTRGDFFRTTDFGDSWIKFDSPLRNTFYSVHFANKDTGWTVGEDGAIFRSTNGGVSWFELSNKISSDFLDVDFSSKQKGWLLSFRTDYVSGWASTLYTSSAEGSTIEEIKNWGNKKLEAVTFINDSTGWVTGVNIYKTTNGGKNWINQTFNSSLWFYDICFVDKNNGWTVGLGGNVYRTTNGGTTWTKQNINTSLGIINIQMLDKDTGWCAGENGMLFQTSNGGNDWIKIPSDIYGSITGMSFINNSTGWVASNNIYKTTDSGSSWREQASFDNQIHYIKFVDSLNGYACGNAGIIFKSSDGGITWEQMTPVTGESMWSGYFFDKDNGWMVGNNGVLLALSSGVTSADDKIAVNKLPDNFKLYQNYPNPFNPSTVINYQLSSSANVSLKIYDALGREVETIVNKKQSPGNYKVEFNGAGLASGVYIYRLQAGGFTSTKKMILLR